MRTSFEDFILRLTSLTRLPAVPIPESLFDDLARQLFRLQFTHVTPYKRFCEARNVHPDSIAIWSQIPHVPTESFKEILWTSLAPGQHIQTFLSSGTTGHQPGRHLHDRQSLTLYEASAWPWFQRHLLPSPLAQPRILALVPPPHLAPQSSLVHMIDTIARAWPTGNCQFVGGTDSAGTWTLDLNLITARLIQFADNASPVVLLGTAFAFVQLLDHLVDHHIQLRLPTASRVMETGGYKGRSRALPKTELHRWIQDRLGIPESHIVSEYGMTELSSQAYDRVAGDSDPSAPRRFRFPPWARVQTFSPETGLPVEPGQPGLLRVLDLANVRSVAAIQTEDLAILHEDEFELLGRAAGSEPRGCSLRHLTS